MFFGVCLFLPVVTSLTNHIQVGALMSQLWRVVGIWESPPKAHMMWLGTNSKMNLLAQSPFESFKKKNYYPSFFSLWNRQEELRAFVFLITETVNAVLKRIYCWLMSALSTTCNRSLETIDAEGGFSGVTLALRKPHVTTESTYLAHRLGWGFDPII